ncbi:lysophospholipid acyltransferase family protein [Limnobacter humi]|uniref:Lysophospholipid acyltransferase family protein n=1 Tax=Limnobacter humi TaxID=1778671 RepID=A0ABT1WBC3_9BURK|nr:lysophospholipid acyltransferase family protein [Limnobacter humi]MCQ8894829.1 lysophospholipid acyltransferase family protein [Limnobacter humi]
MIKPLFNLLARFPLPLLHAIGAVLGWAVYGLSASYRRKIHQHAAIAFGSHGSLKWKAVRGSVAQAGMALLELPFLWGRKTDQGVAACAEITGWDVVDSAREKGRGMLFLTPHMGSFESAAQIFSTRQAITVLYRPNRKPELQQIIETSRARDGVGIAPTNLSGVKILLKALRRGEAVGLLPDQVPSNGEGVWAPMFGQPAYTMTLPGRLVNTTGASVILAIGYRKPFGQGFRLDLYPGPVQLSEDPVEAATQVNQAMEALILKHPEQYYWGYERYKAPKNT